jgi:lysophospholipase L1-like esterase
MFNGILLNNEDFTDNVVQTNNCPVTMGVGTSCNFSLQFNSGAPYLGVDWAQYGQYAAANQTLIAGPPNPSRLVFMGDSITLFWDQPAPYGAGSLQAVKPFVNRGIDGQTTEQILVRLWEDALKLNPAVVHIFAGTNDLGGNTGPETNTEIMDQLTSIVEVAQANNVKILIASVTPVVNLSGGNVWTDRRPNPQIVALNQSIQALCQQTGAVYVDYYDALVDPTTGAMNVNLTVDGLHPNTAGYALMVPVAQAALAKVGY